MWHVWGRNVVRTLVGKAKKQKKKETTWNICVRCDGNEIDLKEINVVRCGVD
jgi:hypothetical protein